MLRRFMQTGAFAPPTSALVCSAKDDDGEGGEGGGFSEAQIRVIANIANQATSSQLKRVKKELMGELGKISETVSRLVPANAGDDDAGDDDAGDDDAGDSGRQAKRAESRPSKRELALEREVKKLKRHAEEQSRKAQEAEQAERERKKSETLRKALESANVEPLRLDGALAVVGRNVIEREDGTLAYRVRRNTPTGPFDDDVEIDAGVKEWAGTTEGKAYLRPETRPGMGVRPGGEAPAHRGGPASKEQRVAAARQTLRQGVMGLLYQGGAVGIGGDNSGGIPGGS